MQKFTENNIDKKANISLVECNSERIPQAHLHIVPGATGYDLNAGIFKRP